MGITTDRNDPALKNIDPQTNLQEKYLVLSNEELAKGFVRPVRYSYVHVGKRPTYSLRDLTEEEHNRYDDIGYIQYEEYPKDSNALGRFWTYKELNSGCGITTTMGTALSETYARSPSFYGGTYCCGCQKHFDVGEKGEFIWEGTTEKVGT